MDYTQVLNDLLNNTAVINENLVELTDYILVLEERLAIMSSHLLTMQLLLTGFFICIIMYAILKSLSLFFRNFI